MKPRRVIASDTTPSGESIQLVHEQGHYVVRVNGAPLMSSAMHDSERAMAAVAAERVGSRVRARVLVGGLGMGFTLRAALDHFGADARVTVAELIPAIVRYNRGELAALANHPLDDPRTTLVQGDVRASLSPGAWDAILLDVDNGPEAFTVESNRSLYGPAGVQAMTRALAPGGVAVVWSAFPSPEFERVVRSAGLPLEVVGHRARSHKGPKHTLFVIGPRPAAGDS